MTMELSTISTYVTNAGLEFHHPTHSRLRRFKGSNNHRRERTKEQSPGTWWPPIYLYRQLDDAFNHIFALGNGLESPNRHPSHLKSDGFVRVASPPFSFPSLPNFKAPDYPFTSEIHRAKRGTEQVESALSYKKKTNNHGNPMSQPRIS